MLFKSRYTYALLTKLRTREHTHTLSLSLPLPLSLSLYIYIYIHTFFGIQTELPLSLIDAGTLTYILV